MKRLVIAPFFFVLCVVSTFFACGGLYMLATGMVSGGLAITAAVNVVVFGSIALFSFRLMRRFLKEPSAENVAASSLTANSPKPAHEMACTLRSGMQRSWMVPLLFVPFLVSSFFAITLLIAVAIGKIPAADIVPVVLFGAMAVYLFRLIRRTLNEPGSESPAPNQIIDTSKKGNQQLVTSRENFTLTIIAILVIVFVAVMVIGATTPQSNLTYDEKLLIIIVAGFLTIVQMGVQWYIYNKRKKITS